MANSNRHQDKNQNCFDAGLFVVKTEEDLDGTDTASPVVKIGESLVDLVDTTIFNVKVEDADTIDAARNVARSDENFVCVDGVLKIEETTSELVNESRDTIPVLTHPMFRFRQLHSNIYSSLDTGSYSDYGSIQTDLRQITDTGSVPKLTLTDEDSASIQSIIERPYQCGKCGKSSRTIADLKKHFMTHTNGKRYQCDFCGKEMRTSSDLTKHVRTHTKEKPYQCTHCPKAFTEKGNLVNHIRTHTLEKPYKCEECGRGFAEKKTLKDHTRTHTGEKPYKCEICNRGFAQNSHLARHVRTHDKVKPYPCEECGKSFVDKEKLSRHFRTHRRHDESVLFISQPLDA